MAAPNKDVAQWCRERARNLLGSEGPAYADAELLQSIALGLDEPDEFGGDLYAAFTMLNDMGLNEWANVVKANSAKEIASFGVQVTGIADALEERLGHGD